jgi:nicotinamidase/pyrazinamidase
MMCAHDTGSSNIRHRNGVRFSGGLQSMMQVVLSREPSRTDAAAALDLVAVFASAGRSVCIGVRDMADPRQVLRPGDALIVVDVQVDFCPGGALAIDGCDEVVRVLNHWMAAAAEAGVPIYLSRDWHPRNHLSFKERGGEWPVHCLQDSPGARFHPALKIPEDAHIVTKGVRFDRDQYSAFDETGLATELRRRGVRRLWIGGLAQDVCVRATALDARREGFEVILIVDATRPVTRERGERALEEMRQAGVRFETTSGMSP